MSHTLTTAHLLDEDTAVKLLLNRHTWGADKSLRAKDLAREMMVAIRHSAASITDIEQFLVRYPLTSPQGLALMTLAESLLRIPDSETANALIRETLDGVDWSHAGGDDLFGKTLRMGLSAAQKTAGSSLFGGVAMGALRLSITEMVKHLGSQFVIAETILDATKKAKNFEANGFRLSYDMLGEGARTADDAERYFQNYLKAIETIAEYAAPHADVTKNPSVSVKLSALHPRYHWAQADLCVPEMTNKMRVLCHAAAKANISLTIDAEESDRLELSFDILEHLMADKKFEAWHGLGLAVQAYDKRCVYVLNHLISRAKFYNRRLQIRLVKGAYWDTEIKRAQVAGLSDYPVFTKKINTDLSYLTAAEIMLSHQAEIYPMFATHNAMTAASILTMAPQNAEFEFQRLYGMGADLALILKDKHKIPVSIYAPVGSYHDLLPYLVRRMLENGANTSFVSHIRNPATPIDDLLQDAHEIAGAQISARHKSIPLPKNIYGDARLNSNGIDLSNSKTRNDFFARLSATIIPDLPAPQSNLDQIVSNARAAFYEWNHLPATARADYLNKIAALCEAQQFELIKLLQTEGKKTIADAIGEVRETIDFARYYAAEGIKHFGADGTVLRGPTGEDNILKLTGRGVFVAISPWNFPLAIFCGQVFAAMMAGNTVIAKPAEQTPMIAKFCAAIFHEAGVPHDVMQLVIGDGAVGAALALHKNIDGVVFTGSSTVAKLIERSLASKDGNIVPLIAETGGQNAMIVDTTALPEHVVDDVMQSAFGSAGQRCSALRVLYLPHETSDHILNLLKGALSFWRVGDPKNIQTDMGALIDDEAFQKIAAHCKKLTAAGKLIAQSACDLPPPYIAAHVFEISSIADLSEEIFGPVLHIIRYHPRDLDRVIDEINRTGYGLTCGVHSRLKTTHQFVSDRIRAGNIYINRTMIGAVVGVQPFGGMGLSGTGPKAGGPHYLMRFATEQVISTNTMAAGGNLKLLTLPQD